MKRMFALLAVTILGTFQAFPEDIFLEYNGKPIVLHEDGTWEYSNKVHQAGDQPIELRKLPNQTSVLESSTEKYRIHFNPLRWDQTKPGNADAEFGLQNKAKTGYSMSIFDGLELPLDSMEALLISNAKNVDANAKMLEKQPCIVNGTPGELVTYTATGNGISFTLLTYVATGEFGSIQFTFYTTTAAFAKLKPEFIEAISGIEF